MSIYARSLYNFSCFPIQYNMNALKVSNSYQMVCVCAKLCVVWMQRYRRDCAVLMFIFCRNLSPEFLVFWLSLPVIQFGHCRCFVISMPFNLNIFTMTSTVYFDWNRWFLLSKFYRLYDSANKQMRPMRETF